MKTIPFHYSNFHITLYLHIHYLQYLTFYTYFIDQPNLQLKQFISSTAHPHLLSTITDHVIESKLKLKYPLYLSLSLFTSLKPIEFCLPRANPTLSPNCFASQYKIQARSSVNVGGIVRSTIDFAIDSWYGFVKGARVWRPAERNLQTSRRSDSDSRFQTRRTHTERGAVHRVYDSCSTQFTMSPR